MVPLDVVDYIFSFLQSDHSTLRKCSKAHPFLARLAQRHLYVFIAVQNYQTTNDPKFSPSEILKTFSERPEILTHVFQGLFIDILALPTDQMDDSLKGITSILSIVSQHPRLKSITLKGRCPFAWRNLPIGFQEAFLNCVRSPFVAELAILDISGFEIRNLVKCEALKRLALQGRFHVLASIRRISIPKLEFLSLSNFRGPLFHIVNWKSLHGLRVLDLSGGSSNFYALQHLLRIHQSSLNCLRLDLADSFHSTYDLDCDSFAQVVFPFHAIELEQLVANAVSYIKTSSRQYFSVLPAIVWFCQQSLVKNVTLRLYFKVEDSFFLHTRDVSLIRRMTSFSTLSRHIKLHISAAKLDGTIIPPSEILSWLEQEVDLMDMVNHGKLFFTAEGHFCKDFSCCPQDISAHLTPVTRQY